MKAQNAELPARYEVLGGLAAGSLSMVSLARRGDGVLVALKRPHPGFVDDAVAQGAFTREVRLLAAVRHPHVLRLEERWADDVWPLAALEYVDGPSLARLQHIIDGGAHVLTRLSAPIAVRVILDVLAALDALATAHGDGGVPHALVHADVSPENVLIGSDGTSKLADFGAARPVGEPAPSVPHGFGPQVAYSSPEALRGEVLDARADVFSAGILLWEMCAGRRLFVGQTPERIARQVAEGFIPDLRQLAPTLPEGVVIACEVALDRELERRFPSARAFANALVGAMTESFGVPRHEAVASAVRHRCADLVAQRARMVDQPAEALQSGVRPSGE